MPGSFESTFCAVCLVGGPMGCRQYCLRGGGVGVWGAGGLAGAVLAAANSRRAIRERSHVCAIISGIRRERGRREGGGGGLEAVCGSYENCSVLKRTTATLHNQTSHNQVPSATRRSLFLFFSRFCAQTPIKSHVFQAAWARHMNHMRTRFGCCWWWGGGGRRKQTFTSWKMRSVWLSA